MANHKSAIKRHRQSLKRRARNRSQRARLRTEIKKFNAAAETGDAAAADQLKLVQKLLDQAADKRLVHPNKASRTLSRLTAKLA